MTPSDNKSSNGAKIPFDLISFADHKRNEKHFQL